MKTLKKSVAVLLAVLMVAFSVPFTALAADKAVVTEIVTTSKSGSDGFLAADNMREDTISASTGDYICVNFILKGPSSLYDFELKGTYDTTYLQPGYWKTATRWAVATSDTNAIATLTGSDDYSEDWCSGNVDMSDGFSCIDPAASGNAIYLGVQNTTDNNAVTSPTTVYQIDADGNDSTYTVDGMPMFSVRFKVLQDVANIYDCFTWNASATKMMTAKGGDWLSLENGGLVFAPDAEPVGPTTTTYTYVNAAGKTVDTQEVESADALEAPANTATSYVSASTNTHTKTTYSWPATADTENKFTEVATPAVENCSNTSTVVTAPTKDAQGYTTYTCKDCGNTWKADYTDATGYTYKQANGTTGTVANESALPAVSATGYVSNGTNTHAKTTYAWVTGTDVDFEEKATTATESCTNCATVVTDPGKETQGYTTYTCKDCGNVWVADYTAATGYTYKQANGTTGKVANEAALPAVSATTYTAIGDNEASEHHTKTTYAWVTGSTYDFEEVATQSNLNCDFSYQVITEATKAEDGLGRYTCSDCGYTYDVVIPALGYDTVTYTYEFANGTSTTVNCKENESPVAPANTATTGYTCNDNGTDTYTTYAWPSTATGMRFVEIATPHTADCDMQETAAAVAPTRQTAGSTAQNECTRCGYTTGGEVIPALGVAVTTVGSELGSSVVNGVKVSSSSANLVYGSTYTVEATPYAGASFVGWMANGKIVSTNTSYSTVAIADVEYTPVFAEEGEATFTVTFMDTYGNVITSLSNTEVADLEELPAAPSFPGLTFTGYSMTLEEVKELIDSAVVYAQYAADEAKTYTITATGSTITVNGTEYDGVATGIPYDAKVTVTAADAKSWSANGKVVAYGASYEFYCAADVDVTFDTNGAVTAAPALAGINVTTPSGTNYQVSFLASRAVPEGYTLIESGFVYGKNVSQDELTLDNVDVNLGSNKLVKSVACSNKSAVGQFQLTFGVTAKTGTACARSYVIYKDAESATHVIYADMQSYAY